LGWDEGSQNREFIDQVGCWLATVVGLYEASSAADEFREADRVLVAADNFDVLQRLGEKVWIEEGSSREGSGLKGNSPAGRKVSFVSVNR
jgi:hypothetical protein